MDAPSPASPDIRRIPIVVDKSHLITIGEKLYTEKTSFLTDALRGTKKKMV